MLSLSSTFLSVSAVAVHVLSVQALTVRGDGLRSIAQEAKPPGSAAEVHHDADVDLCAICYEEFQSDDDIRSNTFACGHELHRFHAKCLASQAKHLNGRPHTCPICRPEKSSKTLVTEAAVLAVEDRDSDSTAWIENILDFVENGHEIDSPVTDDGNTMLMLAADNNRPEIVNYLLDEDSSPLVTDNSGVSAVEHIYKSFLQHENSRWNDVLQKATNHIVSALQEDLDQPINQDGETLLMFTAKTGQVEIFSDLLEKGVSFSKTDKNRRRVFDYCLRNDSVEKVLQLFEALVTHHDSNMDFSTSDNGLTMLGLAHIYGDLDIVTEMKKRGASKYTTDPRYKTLANKLEHETESSVLAYYEEHCENMTSLNLPIDQDGFTLLMVATIHGKAVMVDEFVKDGADPFVTNACGISAIDFALSADHSEDKVDELMDSFVNAHDINWTTNNGDTMLTLAVFHGRIGVASMLLDKGASPRLPINAVFDGHSEETILEMVEMYLKYLREHDDRQDKHPLFYLHHRINKEGDNLLMVATKCGLPLVVSYLLEKDTRISFTNDDGLCAIDYALNENISEEVAVELFELFLAREASVNLPLNEAGDTMLMKAANKGRPEIVSLLLEKGANPLKRNVHGNSAIADAFNEKNSDEVLLRMVESFANKIDDINQVVDDRGNTMLKLAAKFCKINVFQTLKSRGASLSNDAPRRINNYGHDPAHYSHSPYRLHFSLPELKPIKLD